MSGLDAARTLSLNWVAWALLDILLAATVSFLAVRLTGVVAPRRAWTNGGMPWPERARALYPSRRASGLVVVFAWVFFSVFAWVVTAEVPPVPGWALVVSVFTASYAPAHFARFLMERQISPELTLRQYGQGLVLTYLLWVWTLLPALVVFALAGSELGVRWAFACVAGLLVAWATRRSGALLFAKRVGLTEDADARLLSIIERAAVAAGTTPEWVGVLGHPTANAFADPIHRHVVFTAGALAGLSDGQVEAIAQHELGHFEQSGEFRQARALGTILLLLLGSSWPLITRFGYRGLLPFFVLSAFYFAVVHRRRKRGEENADQHALQHAARPAEYAVALERVYELNLVPAVLAKRLAVHPDLYDRQLAAGYAPSYARPRRPSVLRYLTAVFLATGFLVVCAVAFTFAVPLPTHGEHPHHESGDWAAP